MTQIGQNIQSAKLSSNGSGSANERDASNGAHSVLLARARCQNADAGGGGAWQRLRTITQWWCTSRATIGNFARTAGTHWSDKTMAKHKQRKEYVSIGNELKYIERTLKLLIRREREKAAEARDLANRCNAHAQHASRTLSAFRRMCGTLAARAAVVMLVASLLASGARADDNKRQRRQRQHNYIIERQLDYQVPSGSLPTDRLIIGRRQIDVYNDGSMFEGDHMVGTRK